MKKNSSKKNRFFFHFRSYERSELLVHGFNTWELVPDMTDYKLEFLTQKFKNLDEIQHTEIFAVVKFWTGKITEFLRQC